MKTCTSCGTPNRPDAKFCIGCGQSFEQSAAQLPVVTCPTCGFANETGDAFCTNCGATLQPTEPAKPAQPPAAPAASAPEASQDLEVTPGAQESVSRAEISVPPATIDPGQVVPGAPACPACGYMIRFCPDCGAALQTTPDGKLVHSQSPPGA